MPGKNRGTREIMAKSKRDDTSGLTLLGRSGTDYPDHVEAGILETFPNRFADREYRVRMETMEFTSLCPVTGQPDYGSIVIEYVPGGRCIESKSLKLYLFSYRNEPTFMETVTNRILDDLVHACEPREMTVRGVFQPRGGIGITVEASYRRR
jgi:7-cyano-7-deazaguanine reductase